MSARATTLSVRSDKPATGPRVTTLPPRHPFIVATVAPRHFAFVAGHAGQWRLNSVRPVVGETLPAAMRLELAPIDEAPDTDRAAWVLRGFKSNERYTTRHEHDQLVAVQAPLGRPEATRAALIPIRKSPAWWALSQDERRAIFEDRSRHIAQSLRYLPAIARSLFHSRDLGEPFDFLTWFEFAPEHEGRFDDLLARLRASEEWTYVDREIDIRLVRA